MVRTVDRHWRVFKPAQRGRGGGSRLRRRGAYGQPPPHSLRITPDPIVPFHKQDGVLNDELMVTCVEVEGSKIGCNHRLMMPDPPARRGGRGEGGGVMKEADKGPTLWKFPKCRDWGLSSRGDWCCQIVLLPESCPKEVAFAASTRCEGEKRDA